MSGSVVVLPTGLRALINVVPLVVVGAVAGLVALVPVPSIGFPLAGLIGAGGYVVLLSGFFWVVTPPPRAQADDQAVDKRRLGGAE